MLASEAQNAAGDNVVRMTKEPDTKIKEEQIEPKEEESVKPVISDDKTSHVLFRENLKKLISNAGINVKDKKIASLLEEETQTDNAVKVKSESKKDLIKNIIKEVVKQGPEKESSYVVGLLKEVSSSKIDILKVEKDSTIVKIKEGDNLWNIAKRIYGNGFKYKLIYEANKDKLTNPNLVTVGMIIKVPKSE
jgi:nucleoid-associated protein YgaU